MQVRVGEELAGQGGKEIWERSGRNETYCSYIVLVHASGGACPAHLRLAGRPAVDGAAGAGIWMRPGGAKRKAPRACSARS